MWLKSCYISHWRIATVQTLFGINHMARRRPLNPLNGITLEMMLEQLVAHLGWEAMGEEVPIRCFTHEPSVPSSLKFLRKTPWARTKVEWLYRNHQKKGSSTNEVRDSQMADSEGS